jgi:hypothetical protein
MKGIAAIKLDDNSDPDSQIETREIENKITVGNKAITIGPVVAGPCSGKSSPISFQLLLPHFPGSFPFCNIAVAVVAAFAPNPGNLVVCISGINIEYCLS